MTNRIKDLRIEKKLTQEELSKILRVSRGNVSKYENEDLDISNDKLKILADFFNVSVDYLLGIAEERNLTIVKEEGLPYELKGHIEEISMLKEAIESGLSASDIKEILELGIKLKKKP